MRPAICTVSGIVFDLLRPEVGMVEIGDIAHALSNMPRFAGHTRAFYSVAQHSCLVHDIVAQWNPADPETTRIALLHDAAEAYVLDMPTPLKSQLRSYRVIEDRIRAVIFRRYDIRWAHEGLPRIVKFADRRALYAERRDLMPPGDWFPLDAGPDVSSIDPIAPLTPAEARAAFLSRWASTTSSALSLTA